MGMSHQLRCIQTMMVNRAHPTCNCKKKMPTFVRTDKCDDGKGQDKAAGM